MKAVGRPQKWTKMCRSGRKSVGARYWRERKIVIHSTLWRVIEDKMTTFKQKAKLQNCALLASQTWLWRPWLAPPVVLTRLVHDGLANFDLGPRDTHHSPRVGAGAPSLALHTVSGYCEFKVMNQTIVHRAYRDNRKEEVIFFFNNSQGFWERPILLQETHKTTYLIWLFRSLGSLKQGFAK